MGRWAALMICDGAGIADDVDHAGVGVHFHLGDMAAVGEVVVVAAQAPRWG